MYAAVTSARVNDVFLPDGERYEGSTLHDARHGAGVCHYLDGDEYEGQV